MNRKLVNYVFFMVWVLSSCAMAAETAEYDLMPLPQKIVSYPGELTLNKPLSVQFVGFSDERKTQQIVRLQQHLNRLLNKPFDVHEASEQAQLRIVVKTPEINLTQRQLDSDESYTLTISQRGIKIKAGSVFGAQHGLTTLVQLFVATNQGALRLPHIEIIDEPRFKWRGLLVDSVRHFISLDTIKRQLDGMAAAKLNVLHWHLTDDQGWRIESKQYPKLTALASDGLYYTQAQIKEVVHYANLLGIRVVPEFGMPGHASAIAVAYPELMTKQTNYKMERQWGVFKPLLDVSNPAVYTFIDNLIGEMSALFPDHYLHIGGDEVEPEHWLENQQIRALMAQYQLKTGHDIQNYFNTRILPILTKHNRIMMGWDEIFHPQLPKQILVQSWRGHDSLNAVANAGYQGILSTGFYIDQPQYTSFHYRNDPLKTAVQVDTTQPVTLAKRFVIERLKGSDVKGELVILGEQVLIKLNQNHHQLTTPSQAFSHNGGRLQVAMDSWMGPLSFEFDFNNSKRSAVMIGNSRYPISVKPLTKHAPITLSQPVEPNRAQLILGGEATIWSEMVHDDNLDLRIWPRLFAIAERLWSDKNTVDSRNMYQRLSHIDNFAADVIGLHHQQQQAIGFMKLTQGRAENKALLRVMAELVEPSHYYTRHHIKYRKNEYHQLTPLNLFVDYLPVESQKVRMLRDNVQDFMEGDEVALTRVSKQLDVWQKQLTKLAPQAAQFDKNNIAQLYHKLIDFMSLSQAVVSVCKSQKTKSQKTTPALDGKLLGLQLLTDEIVIAGIYPMRDLYITCRQ